LVKPLHKKPSIRNIVCCYDYPLRDKECLDLFQAFKKLKPRMRVKYNPESTIQNLFVWFDGLFFWVSPNGKVVIHGMKSFEKYEASQEILNLFWERHLKKFKVRK
jgi:hypothetical protein